MPFKPGRKKTGGRKKGMPNMRALPLIEKAKELGVDPFEVLLLFAAGDWKKLGYQEESMTKINQYGATYEYTIDPSVRAKAAAEACQYLYPKRKAIEFNDKTKKKKTGFERFTNEQLTLLAMEELKK